MYTTYKMIQYFKQHPVCARSMSIYVQIWLKIINLKHQSKKIVLIDLMPPGTH